MIQTNNPIIKHQAGLLNLAEELGNVSRACKVIGVSRDTLYRYQELVEQGGPDGLLDKNRRSPNINIWCAQLHGNRSCRALTKKTPILYGD